MARKHSIVGNDLYKWDDVTGAIKYVNIGGRWFELVGKVDNVRFFGGNDRSEIYNVYGRPSITKVSIWNDWCKWADENDGNIEIASHNCMFFTITGNAVSADNTIYELYITAAHNRASIVTS